MPKFWLAIIEKWSEIGQWPAVILHSAIRSHPRDPRYIYHSLQKVLRCNLLKPYNVLECRTSIPLTIRAEGEYFDAFLQPIVNNSGHGYLGFFLHKQLCHGLHRIYVYGMLPWPVWTTDPSGCARKVLGKTLPGSILSTGMLLLVLMRERTPLQPTWPIALKIWKGSSLNSETMAFQQDTSEQGYFPDPSFCVQKGLGSRLL